MSRARLGWGLIGAAFLAACVGPTSAGSPQPDPLLIERARQATEAENWSLALELWNEAIYTDGGQSPAPFHETARALLAQGERATAMAILHQGLRYHPEDSDLLESRGVLLARAGFLRAAEEHFGRAVQSDPERSRSWLWLGRMRLELDLPHLAISALDTAVEGGERHTEAYQLLARGYRASGGLRQSAEWYVRALEAEPAWRVESRVEAASLLAESPALALDQPELLVLSQGWLESVIATDPQHAQAHFVRGLLYEQSGEIEAALEAYHRAVEVDNFHLQATRNLSILHRDQGEWERARELAERALEIESDPERRRVLRELLLPVSAEPQASSGQASALPTLR